MPRIDLETISLEEKKEIYLKIIEKVSKELHADLLRLAGPLNTKPQKKFMHNLNSLVDHANNPGCSSCLANTCDQHPKITKVITKYVLPEAPGLALSHFMASYPMTYVVSPLFSTIKYITNGIATVVGGVSNVIDQLRNIISNYKAFIDLQKLVPETGIEANRMQIEQYHIDIKNQLTSTVNNLQGIWSTSLKNAPDSLINNFNNIAEQVKNLISSQELLGNTSHPMSFTEINGTDPFVNVSNRLVSLLNDIDGVRSDSTTYLGHEVAQYSPYGLQEDILNGMDTVEIGIQITLILAFNYLLWNTPVLPMTGKLFQGLVHAIQKFSGYLSHPNPPEIVKELTIYSNFHLEFAYSFYNVFFIDDRQRNSNRRLKEILNLSQEETQEHEKSFSDNRENLHNMLYDMYKKRIKKYSDLNPNAFNSEGKANDKYLFKAILKDYLESIVLIPTYFLRKFYPNSYEQSPKFNKLIPAFIARLKITEEVDDIKKLLAQCMQSDNLNLSDCTLITNRINTLLQSASLSKNNLFFSVACDLIRNFTDKMPTDKQPIESQINSLVTGINNFLRKFSDELNESVNTHDYPQLLNGISDLLSVFNKIYGLSTENSNTVACQPFLNSIANLLDTLTNRLPNVSSSESAGTSGENISESELNSLNSLSEKINELLEGSVGALPIEIANKLSTLRNKAQQIISGLNSAHNHAELSNAPSVTILMPKEDEGSSVRNPPNIHPTRTFSLNTSNNGGDSNQSNPKHKNARQDLSPPPVPTNQSNPKHKNARQDLSPPTVTRNPNTPNHSRSLNSTKPDIQNARYDLPPPPVPTEMTPVASQGNQHATNNNRNSSPYTSDNPNTQFSSRALKLPMSSDRNNSSVATLPSESGTGDLSNQSSAITGNQCRPGLDNRNALALLNTAAQQGYSAQETVKTLATAASAFRNTPPKNTSYFGSASRKASNHQYEPIELQTQSNRPPR